MFRWVSCADKKWLKADEMRGSEAKTEGRHKLQRFDDDETSRVTYLELFRKEVSMRVVEEFLQFIAELRRYPGGRMVDCLARLR